MTKHKIIISEQELDIILIKLSGGSLEFEFSGNVEFWKLCFREGMNIANTLQPYSKEDMKAFFLWLRPKLVEDDGTNFLLWGEEKTKTFNKLLKLWEESKNG